MGLGQGYMLITPLQLATAMSVFANKGKWKRAKLVQYIDGVELEDETPPADVQIKNPADWDRMSRAMEGVIKHYMGTAKALQKDLNYRIAAKTGTAQVVSIKQNEEYDSEALLERQRDHALFVSFAPVESPEIAIAVIVENGESAGRTSGPIAREVTDFYLNSLKQRPMIDNEVFGLGNLGTKL